MIRFFAAIMVLCMVFLCTIGVQPVSAGATIYVTGGPEGGWRVSTPVEDFVVIPYGGGVYWVGTQKEYDKGVAKAWAATHGFREAHIMGEEDAAAVFVPTATLKAYLPNVTIDNIVTTIKFGASGVPKSQRGIIIYWNQSNATPVVMVLINQRTRRIYRPYAAFNDQGYINEDFAIPFTALKDPMVAFFYSAHRKGAAVGMRSIAWAHYNILRQTVSGLREDGIPVTKDQLATLGYLRVTDPTIAATEKSRTTPKAVPARRAVPTPDSPSTASPEPTQSEPIATATPEPVPTAPVASVAEYTFDRASVQSGHIYVYLNAHPLQDVDTSAEDFEIKVPLGTFGMYSVERGIVHSGTLHLRAGESRAMIVEFPLPPNAIGALLGGSLRWYYHPAN